MSCCGAIHRVAGWGEARAGAPAAQGGLSPGPRLFLSPPGDRYWVFKDNTVEEGYPRPISDFGLPPGGVDAAFSWAHNDKTYFFKDQLYWRYDEHTRRVDPGHPARSPPWRGIPSTLDDAMRWSDGEPDRVASVSPPVEWDHQRAVGGGLEPMCPHRCCPRASRGPRGPPAQALFPLPHPASPPCPSSSLTASASCCSRTPRGPLRLRSRARDCTPSPQGLSWAWHVFCFVFKAASPTPRMAWHIVGPW